MSVDFNVHSPVTSLRKCCSMQYNRPPYDCWDIFHPPPLFLVHSLPPFIRAPHQIVGLDQFYGAKVTRSLGALMPGRISALGSCGMNEFIRTHLPGHFFTHLAFRKGDGWMLWCVRRWEQDRGEDMENKREHLHPFLLSAHFLLVHVQCVCTQIFSRTWWWPADWRNGMCVCTLCVGSFFSLRQLTPL